MTPIDLTDYTDSSEKIPADILKPAVHQENVSSWTILAGYFLDFTAIMSFTLMTSAIFAMSLSNFMVSKSLRTAFKAIEFSSLNISLLPLIFVSYFFFSYFFNHGQTWGMNVMKSRIEMKEMSFRSSLLWAMFSAVIMMTGGISYLFTYQWMQMKNWGEFKNHDHLYFELMQERNLSPVNLLAMTNTTAATKVVESEEQNYLKAA